MHMLGKADSQLIPHWRSLPSQIQHFLSSQDSKLCNSVIAI